ncbi:unnamed protein product [Rhizoctonia solani]|uniref:Uncharacterized protein n=1 Tax=Rhizoctonia solani TaxID=456999 RepID=A0A8H2WMW7_9AGAM|nr:unnamed protein product [Rhizoctonia solani]
MHPEIRTFGLIVFSWLTLLSFFVIYNQHTSNHRTPRFAPDGNIEFNFHGPVNVYNYRDHFEWAERPSYYLERLGFLLWLGCLWLVFILGRELKYGRAPEQPKIDNGCTCHQPQAGRTLAVASGQLDGTAPSGLEVSSPNDPKSTRNIHGQRGRQLPSQGPSLPLTPPLRGIKEPHADSFEDWMPSFATTVQGWQFEGKSSPVDRESVSTLESRANRPLLSSTLRARLYPVQAPPASRSRPNGNDQSGSLLKDPTVPSRIKQVKIKAKDRFSPSDTRRSHRGSTPGAVETSQAERKNSLESTLYGNHCLLPQDTVIWFILIVAVDYPGRDLQDPEHDLKFWRKMLDDPALDSETIYLVELAGKDATPQRIKESFAQLYHDSEAMVTVGHPKLFVYLTGEGDADQNRMHLLDGKFLSERDIDRWLGELRTSYRYTRPVTLVLDICRINKDFSSAKMHHGVELIYSSSSGEKAHALRFKSEQDTPYSSFMLAFVVASSVSPTSTAAEFVAAVEQRLGQLTGLVSLAAAKEGNDNPGSQHPDWNQAGVRNI